MHPKSPQTRGISPAQETIMLQSQNETEKI